MPFPQIVAMVEDIQNLQDELVGEKVEFARAREEASHQKALKDISRQAKNEAEQKPKDAEEKIVSEFWEYNRRKWLSADQIQNKHLFGVVLIDVDAAIFWDEFFRNPKDGAEDAAARLRDVVKASLDNRWMTVLVKVYANVEDLAERLYTSGVIQSKDDLTAFAKAFTHSFPEFEFVNVGSEKSAKMHSKFYSGSWW